MSKYPVMFQVPLPKELHIKLSTAAKRAEKSLKQYILDLLTAVATGKAEDK